MTIRLMVVCAIALMTCHAPVLGQSVPTVERHGETIRVSLDGDVQLSFALEGDLLLGLNRAKVGGVELTSGQTVQRPLLAEEWREDRMIWPLMRLRSAEVDGRRVVLTADLLGTNDEQAYRQHFVFVGNHERARQNMPAELQALADDAEAARKAFDNVLGEHPKVQALQQQIAEWQQRLTSDISGERKWATRRKLARADERMRALQRGLLDELVGDSAERAAALKRIERFEAALDERALEVGDIHRDLFRFAHTRIPAQINQLDELRQWAAKVAPRMQPAGTIRWIITAESRNVAGWPWRGWSQQYAFELPEGRAVNNLRQLGTWEIDGSIDGLNVVNLRYRGLGRLEQRLHVDEQGGAAEAWMTSDIMPGAAGEAPVISPAIPRGEGVADRGNALRHRHGAWISRCGRGAGHNFVDFQYRPHAALASFYQRQGNLRALSEIYPGDRHVSQTDEQWFNLTNRHTTQTQVYLALTMDQPHTAESSRTRWKEVDQHVRDQVSQELGFVQFEAEPAVGYLLEVKMSRNVAGIAEHMPMLAERGVKQVLVHNPGWVNGRQQNVDGPAATGGGICSVYSWQPLDETKDAWRSVGEAAAAHDIAYYVWLTGMVWGDTPFVDAVGREREHWGINSPHDQASRGYDGHLAMNIRSPQLKQTLTEQLRQTRQAVGYQGFWADSFQNMFMSQLDWGATGERRGGSLQRAWWEQIAAWTQQGIGWMSESQSFPGLSCSIEVHGWEQQPWLFQHVSKWYRGDSQWQYTPKQRATSLFRIMANKGWLAPDLTPVAQASWLKVGPSDPEQIIPDFTRMADAYNAALPQMRRPYLLSDERGVLWLPFDSDTQGVWFAYVDADVPDGVRVEPMTGDDAVADRVTGQRTYRVSGERLLESFGIARPPLDDPRKGRDWQPPRYGHLTDEAKAAR